MVEMMELEASKKGAFQAWALVVLSAPSCWAPCSPRWGGICRLGCRPGSPVPGRKVIILQSGCTGWVPPGCPLPLLHPTCTGNPTPALPTPTESPTECASASPTRAAQA